MINIAIIEEDRSRRIDIVDQLLSNGNVHMLFLAASVQDFQDVLIKHLPVLPDIVLFNSFGDTVFKNKLSDQVKKSCPDAVLINYNLIKSGHTLILNLEKGKGTKDRSSLAFNLNDFLLNIIEVNPHTPTHFQAAISYNKTSSLRNLVTKREMDVIEGLASGLTYAEIAANMLISINTIRFYVKSIYHKLHVRNKIQMVNKFHESIEHT